VNTVGLFRYVALSSKEHFHSKELLDRNSPVSIRPTAAGYSRLYK
jgi:hypothetical protein